MTSEQVLQDIYNEGARLYRLGAESEYPLNVRFYESAERRFLAGMARSGAGVLPPYSKANFYARAQDALCQAILCQPLVNFKSVLCPLQIKGYCADRDIDTHFRQKVFTRIKDDLCAN